MKRRLVLEIAFAMSMMLPALGHAGFGSWTQDREYRSQVYVLGASNSVFTIYFSKRQSSCVPTGVVGYVGSEHMVGGKFANERSILFIVDGRRFSAPIVQFNPGAEVFIGPELLNALKNGGQLTIRGAAGQQRYYQINFSLRNSHRALSAAEAFCKQPEKSLLVDR